MTSGNKKFLKEFFYSEDEKWDIPLIQIPKPKKDFSTVQFGTRPINATLTREAVEDIRGQHGIDVVAELERILTEELNNAMISEFQRLRDL
jgi:hypothetical protein